MTPRDFIFFGTPDTAAQTLERLLAAGRTPLLVVTNPDAPRGRKMVLTPSPVRVMAEQHGIEVYTPQTLDAEAISHIGSRSARYGIVVAYGKIFPEALIQSFPLGVLNVHYSLLPRWRGASPVEAALLAGDTQTGITIQKMVKKLDAGDVLAQAHTDIDPQETVRELRPRLIGLGAATLLHILPAFENGELMPRPQDETLSTHCGKFSKADGELNLAAPASENWAKYRAFADTIGTFFLENGVRNKITEAHIDGDRFVVDRIIPEGKTERPYSASA